ncbi:putative UDP-Glycosyltransferase superfamily protein [Hibiscus syriacus]|uniref:UDP-Glycosyltransferase superfamily protein n=1 Tax=Hibiscus syriacus TaxID=106335 RepID=A0A6A3ADS3_HIBSY|nr:putative UDP-Glycosyltransferase superfamily protein [Hibiscus syriacus]
MATNLHVVMVPWLAFGHLIPFFQLSLQLAKAGIRVSFISTPANIRRLLPVPSNIAYLLELVAFPLPSLDNEQLLPQGCEATVDIPSENIQYLKIAYDLLRHPVKQFVIDQKPDWILVDTLPYWVIEIAQEHRIPLKNIRSSPESLTLTPEWFDFPSPLAYPRFLASGLHGGYYGQNASGISDDQRVAKVIQASKAVAIRFGSECKLSKEQVQEIAYGVELSGLPFLWALRKPDWAVNELDTLPCGFRERTQGRGVVCFGWAPQMEILGHPSIGGSLFHSGWGSVIETLQFGHTLVVLPFVIDQPLNARLLVDKGLAVEIERSEDGSFGRDDIAKALRLAMVSGGGEKLRSRAREAAQVFGNRDLQDTYFNRFVEYLKENGAANQ